MKKIGEITVNDGKGLMDNEGLCDSLIIDMNDLMKAMAAGQYLKFNSLMVGMVQKVTNLKKGIRMEMAAKDEEIRDIKKINSEMTEKAFGVQMEKEEGTEGNDDGGH